MIVLNQTQLITQAPAVPSFLLRFPLQPFLFFGFIGALVILNHVCAYQRGWYLMYLMYQLFRKLCPRPNLDIMHITQRWT